MPKREGEKWKQVSINEANERGKSKKREKKRVVGERKRGKRKKKHTGEMKEQQAQRA